VELYLHSPNMASWRGAQLKYRDNFTFTFTCLVCGFESDKATFISLGLLKTDFIKIICNRRSLKQNIPLCVFSGQPCFSLLEVEI
jgi:hypothetical protein